jgi:o-succinylbenzoate synthase
VDHSLNVTAFEIFEYSLPLRRSFSVSNVPVSSREGAIVRLTSAEGLCGVGEVAPLPGLSAEPLKKALFQLKSLRRMPSEISIPAQLSEFQNIFEREPFVSLSPSVRFGLETAVIHMMAQARRCLPAEILGITPAGDIPVAGLLQGTPDDIGIQAETLLREGFRVFKLKIGSKNIPLDVKKVQLVRQLIGPEKKLRLDVNRTWSLEEATAFCRSAGTANIEFIEEPLKDAADLDAFGRETRWPVALDETLWNFAPEAFVFPAGVAAIVIKPAVVGGICRAMRWIARAQKENKDIIISSSFESGVGARMLANLAAFSPSAAGLGTEDWFAEDLLPALRAGGRSVIPVKSLMVHWSEVDVQKLIPVID